MTDDIEILRDLERHLRKHEVGCFDLDSDDQERAAELVDWLAKYLETLEADWGYGLAQPPARQ